MKFEKRRFIKNWRKSQTPRVTWGLLPFNPMPTTFTTAVLNQCIENTPNQLSYEALKPKAKIKIKLKRFLVLSDIKYTDESPSIFDTYNVLRYSSFIDFFESREVDIPRCFKHVSSLRRLNFELPLLKFANYLMKTGKKEQTFKQIALSFQILFLTHKKSLNYTNTFEFTKWLDLYYFYNNTIFTKHGYSTIHFSRYANLINHHFIKENIKYYSELSNPKVFALKQLLFLQPLFHFSAFSLDKKAKKFARRKNMKYIFIWKYVPIYKRKALLLKLIASDTKFNSGKTLLLRLSSTLNTLYTAPRTSHAYRINNFAHNYVFKNFKRSLLLNYKTTS